MRDEQPVGSLAEEAAQLLGALGEWARDQGADVGSGWAEHLGDGPDASAAECRWCPVCRTLHAVGRTSPEVREQLTIAASALVRAATGILASFADGGRRPSGRAGFERINLDDEHDTGGPAPDVWKD